MDGEFLNFFFFLLLLFLSLFALFAWNHGYGELFVLGRKRRILRILELLLHSSVMVSVYVIVCVYRVIGAWWMVDVECEILEGKINFRFFFETNGNGCR